MISAQAPMSKSQRMRYVRSKSRTRRSEMPGEDALYIDVEPREKQGRPLSPHMQQVHAAMMRSIEHTVASLSADTGLTKAQVTNALHGMAYRHVVERSTDGLRVWWRLD